MKVAKDFSSKALNQIRWWTWAAAVLPITFLAGLFFVWVSGLDSVLDTLMISGATVMFGTAAVWWWWIIYTVSRILKKEQQVAQDLTDASKHIKDLKIIVKETFSKSDK